MKKTNFLLWVVVFVFLSAEVFAVAMDISCDEFYDFQNGIKFEDFHSEKISYAPGEEVILSYNLVNLMSMPVVEGRVRVQIFYVDPNEDEQIIDEFFAFENLNLMPNDILQQEIKWKVPSGAKSGRYEAKVYFLVKDLNLAGLSFMAYGTTGIPGALTEFNVKNSVAESRIYFSKKETKINNKPYEFVGYLFSRNSEPLKIETKIFNEGKAKEVTLKLMTYSWDDVNEKPLDEYTIEKKISIGENSNELISYELPALGPGVYELKFLALSGEEKSILKLRVPISGAKGRFLYLTLDKFPLNANEKTKAFVCFSNSADKVTTFNGKISLELKDRDGKIIFSEKTSAFEIFSDPMGKFFEFTPKDSYTKLTLNAKLLDENEKTHDEISLDYDYSKFSNIPKRLMLSTEKKKFKFGEEIPYTLTYTDNDGRNLKGKFLLYLLNEEGTILDMVEKEINGEFKGKFMPINKAGNYRITARELVKDIKIETDFKVGYEEAQITTEGKIVTTTLPRTEEMPIANLIIWILIVISLIYLVVFFIRKKKGE